MQYTLYPHSLYENIVRGSALKVPMFVTEIGCADASDDDHVRSVNIETSMHQVRVESGDTFSMYPFVHSVSIRFSGSSRKLSQYWCKIDPATLAHLACDITHELLRSELRRCQCL
jgi:hypothetical protein